MTLFCFSFSLTEAQKNVAIIWEIFERPGQPAKRHILLVCKIILKMLLAGRCWLWFGALRLSGPDRWDLALPETGAIITDEKTRH